TTLSEQGHHDDARTLQQSVVDTMASMLGSEDPRTITAMAGLATVLMAGGRDREAGEFHQPGIEDRKQRQWFPDGGNPFTQRNLAYGLGAQGDFAEARQLQQRVLEVRTRVFGAEHPDTLSAMNNLAGTLGALGDGAGSLELQERVLQARKRVLGEDHPDTLIAQ